MIAKTNTEDSINNGLEYAVDKSKSLPDRFADYRNYHKSETIIVCGCGESLTDLVNPWRHITIGVNDVGRLFDPTYLLVVNPKHQFKNNRFSYVQSSRARAVFSQLRLEINHPKLIQFKLGLRGGTEITAQDVLPYTRNSPYVAVCLAAYMGASRIGLIGVDLTDRHFFGNTGKHALLSSLKVIDEEYMRLSQSLARRGVELVNLSTKSRLTSISKSVIDGVNTQSIQSSDVITTNNVLKIVSYSTTPVAGVPKILADCINKYTEHNATCVWHKNGYSNGVNFGGGIEWSRHSNKAVQAIKAADIIILHNGKVAKEHVNIIGNKPVITMAHNYAWNVNQQYINKGFPGVVVAQYQAALPEFKGWHIVPNPLPYWDYDESNVIKNKKITISYTPSAKHEKYPINHRLYWHSKGYDSTISVLDKLARKYPIDLLVVRSRQLPHKKVIEMKQRSHIVIDECVTGSYHRNSLEGLAAGCVVVNGMGLLPEVVDVFSQCINKNVNNPFIYSDLHQLEIVLTRLIESGIESLLKQGYENKLWVKNNWWFQEQWGRFWKPVIDISLTRNNITEADLKKDNNVLTDVPNARNIIPMGTGINCTSTQNDTRINTYQNNILNNKSASIPVYWTCRGTRRGNFGDMLSPVITSALSGRNIHFSNQTNKLFAVGSLLKIARKGDVIWGSGLIDINDKCESDIKICAVRGPLTRQSLQQQGIECPEIYGDPALLLPYIYQLPNVKRNGIGIIPHYVDYENIKRNVHKSGINIIDIRSGIKDVLHKINQCEIILSSSLHGCIAAEAYGIPAAWVLISNDVVGNGFKFHDYYASTDRESVFIDWRKSINIKSAEKAALSSARPVIDLQPLLNSFPYKSSKIHADILAHDMFRSKSNTDNECNHISLKGDNDCRDTIHSEKNNYTDCKQDINGDFDSLLDANINDTSSRIAVFSTGTEDYLKCMIASLRSFMHYNQNRGFDYYVLGRDYSESSQSLLNKYSINYININLNTDFKRRSGQVYPVECFWIFKGPEIFHKKGYKYSLSVDGDTLCNKRLGLSWLTKVEHIAGINRGCDVYSFLTKVNQYRKLKNIFNLSVSKSRHVATNTGVLFYNNSALSDYGFYTDILNVYNKSIMSGVPRDGDDSTLALLMAAHNKYSLYLLDNNWNRYQGIYQVDGKSELKNRKYSENIINNAIIVHHSRLKPWDSRIQFPNMAVKYFINKWNSFLPDSIVPTLKGGMLTNNKILIKNLIGSDVCRKKTYSKKTTYSVNCYWYRSGISNMGDEITPFLISRILSLPPSVNIAPPVSNPQLLSTPVLFSIGSILRLCSNNTVVWGSGIRNINQPVKNAHKFCAVRGRLTHRRLVELGYECPEIIGDPALLLPRYYYPEVCKKYKLGIIPHLVDYNILHKLYGNTPDVLVINASTKDIEYFVRQLLSCENTASTTLHGIVLSIAYNIPTRWLKCSDKIMGDDSKFYDFFSSLNHIVSDNIDTKNISLPGSSGELEYYRPIKINNCKLSTAKILDSVHLYEMTVDLDLLLSTFPLDINGWKDYINK